MSPEPRTERRFLILDGGQMRFSSVPMSVPNCREALSTLLGLAAFAVVTLTCMWSICVKFANADAPHTILVQPTIAATDVASFESRYSFMASFNSRYSVNVAAKNSSKSPIANAYELRETSSHRDVDITEVTSSALSRLPPGIPSTRPRPQIPSIRQQPARNLAEEPEGPSITPTSRTTIFESLFGTLLPPRLALAYAAPEEGPLGEDQSSSAVGYDRSTAVYDISAHTVYMPDGTKLEAHSGRGSMIDDPNHVDEKDRGATPPNVYDLTLRESLFHGVRALRLIPEDTGKVFGRTGFLAHSFMFGPNGDSFGCVSFRDYDAFLQAYLDHKISRLAVVGHLDNPLVLSDRN